MVQLLQRDWICHHRNLLIEGSTGTGKIFLVCVLGQSICQYGLSVRLFEMRVIAYGNSSFRKLLTQLARTELLIIDDWGFDVLGQQQRIDMLETMEDGHGRGAIL